MEHRRTDMNQENIASAANDGDAEKSAEENQEAEEEADDEQVSD